MRFPTETALLQATATALLPSVLALPTSETLRFAARPRLNAMKPSTVWTETMLVPLTSASRSDSPAWPTPSTAQWMFAMDLATATESQSFASASSTTSVPQTPLA